MSGFTCLFVVTVQLELNVIKYLCITLIQAATTVSVSLVPQHTLRIAQMHNTFMEEAKSTAPSSEFIGEVGHSLEQERFALWRELCGIFFSKRKPCCYIKDSSGILKSLPDLKYKSLTVTGGGSTALIVCETSPPDRASSCSLCKAGPSTEEPHAAEGCGGGRTCTTDRNSKDSWGRSCRCLRNDTDVWRSRWGCDEFWRCCQSEGWTSSLSLPCKVKG